jgi:hypothetical protein
MFSEAQLAKFDGSDPLKPVYLAVSNFVEMPVPGLSWRYRSMVMYTM